VSLVKRVIGVASIERHPEVRPPDPPIGFAVAILRSSSETQDPFSLLPRNVAKARTVSTQPRTVRQFDNAIA
jgi:hypothetical protein